MLEGSQWLGLCDDAPIPDRVARALGPLASGLLKLRADLWRHAKAALNNLGHFRTDACQLDAAPHQEMDEVAVTKVELAVPLAASALF